MSASAATRLLKRTPQKATIAATSFAPDAVMAEVCNALGLAGTPEYCADRIADMAKIGARNLYLIPLLPIVPANKKIARHTSIGPDKEMES